MCAVLPNWMLGGLLSSFTSHCVSKVLFDFFFVFCPFRDHEAKNSALAAHSFMSLSIAIHKFVTYFFEFVLFHVKRLGIA